MKKAASTLNLVYGATVHTVVKLVSRIAKTSSERGTP